jgi:hypothetical protein
MRKLDLQRVLLPVLLIILTISPAVADGGGDPGRQGEEISSRNGALLGSLLWPGVGQVAQGRTGRGALWAGGAAALTFSAFFTQVSYNDAAKDYEGIVDRYNEAILTDPDAALGYYNQLAYYHDRAEDRKPLRNIMATSLAVYWVANLVDVWLFDGDTEEQYSSGYLPGRIEPMIIGNRAAVAWSINF